MDESEVLRILLELAEEAKFEIRIAGRSTRQEFEVGAPGSGICRVRGRIWIILSESEPARAQVEVLVQALKEHAGTLIETRYLPPAVRAWFGPRGSGEDRPA
jgi:hypothetical protein